MCKCCLICHHVVDQHWFNADPDPGLLKSQKVEFVHENIVGRY
jgi:hypothetical protein